MDHNRLREAIEERGIKHCAVAKEIGISKELFAQKLLGNVEFKVEEMNGIKKFLKLSTKETLSIFFD